MLPIDKKRFRIPIHILFWALIFVCVFFNEQPELSRCFIGRIMVRTAIYSLPIDIVATYFTIYFLMPKFFYNRRYSSFYCYLLFRLHFLYY